MADPFDAQGLESQITAALGQMPDPAEQKRDALNMALIQALQGFQGPPQRHQGAFGNIVGALAPLAAIPALQKQATQQQQLENLRMKVGLLGLLAKTRGKVEDPEKRAAEIGHLKALASSEEALASERKGKQDYQTRLMKQIEEMTQGQGGAAVGGMKPRVSFGSTGPSLTYSSDVMTPERMQQARELAQIQAGSRVEATKQIETWKQQHPKLTQQQLNALEGGETLMSILDEIPGAVKSIPSTMDRASLATQAGKYQARAEHPIASNLLTGVTGGAVSLDTDPSLDQYFSTVGQAQAALTSFNLVGLRGGQKTLQWLQVHFPGWADDPATVQRKAQFLSSNKGIVQNKIKYLQDRLRNTASIAQEMGAEPVGDQIRVKVRNKKTGQEQFLMIDPETGESSVPTEEPNAAP